MEHQDPFAYIIAILFMISNGLSASMSITLSPLSNILQKYYSSSEWQIYYINSAIAIYYLIFNFVANYLIDRFGVRRSLQLNVILTVLGCYIRTITRDDVSAIELGQTIISIANPLVTNSLSKVSNLWFTPSNRVKMTSIMSSSYMFGLSFGFLLTSMVWSVDIIDDAVFIRNRMDILLFINCLVGFVLGLPVIIYFREKPEISPSPSAFAIRESFLSGLSILKNKNYLLLFLAFSIALSNFFSIISMIYIVLSPFGFEEEKISIIGLIINIFAGLSKICIGFIAGKYITIKNMIMLNFAFKILAVIIFLLCMGPGNTIYFASAFLGFFIQMYWGPAFEYSCELVYPVSESHANGYLVLGGLTGGLFSNYLVTALFSSHLNPNIFFIYLIISYVIAIGFIYMIDNRNPREEFERTEMLKLNFI